MSTDDEYDIIEPDEYIADLEQQLAAVTAERNDAQRSIAYYKRGAEQLFNVAAKAEARAVAVEQQLAETEAQVQFVLQTLDTFGRHDTDAPKEFWALFDVLDSGLALRRAALAQPPEPAASGYETAALAAVTPIDDLTPHMRPAGSPSLGEPAKQDERVDPSVLLGIAPDWCGGLSVDEYLDEMRGHGGE